jgi:transposase
MKPYSPDLRERVLAAVEAGDETQVAVAAGFGVSLSTVEKWWHWKRETGEVTARPQVHGPKRTLEGCEKFIRAQVKKQPDVTLAELCERTAGVQKVTASPSMMCRELQHLGLPRKKVAPRERAGNTARQGPASRIRRTNYQGI